MEAALFVVIVLLALLFGLPIAALVVARKARRGQEEVEGVVRAHKNELDRLHKLVGELRRDIAGLKGWPLEREPEPEPVRTAAVPVTGPAIATPQPAPVVPVPGVGPAQPEPAAAPPPVEAVPRPAPTAAEPPPTPPPAAEAVPPAAPAESAPPPRAEAARPPLPPPPPPPPPPRPPVAPPPPPSGLSALSNVDWEKFIGVKLFSWGAGILALVGVVLFLKVSIDRGWLTPPIRMLIGLLVGAGLLVICEWKAARRYAVTANALDAAGIGILFSTFFASAALWHLLSTGWTFAFMILVTVVAVVLSIRHDSLFIAVLGLLGGFATPALLSTGQNQPIGLFSYLLLLNIGLALVAYWKNWPHLTAFSVALTTLYQWGWAMKFLDSGQLPLAAGIFIVFAVVSVVAMLAVTRVKAPEELSPIFGRSTAISAALPLLFGLYMAAVPAYGARYVLLFGFLLCVDLGLAAVAILRGPELLHFVGGASTILVFAIWLTASYTKAAWPGILLFVCALVCTYALAETVAERLGRPFAGHGKRATIIAPLLLFVFSGLSALEPQTASPWLLFGVLFALLALLAILAVARESGAPYFLGAFFAVAAEAVWSARHLTPDRLIPGLTIYGFFALFYLGVPLVARRLGKKLQPQGAGALVLFLSLALLLFLAAGPVAAVSLWGMALLLMILNVGLFIEGAAAPRSLWTIAGVVLSWIVIAVWWATATVISILIPALMVVAGFAVLVLAGNAWLRSRTGEAALSMQGMYLGLAGHLFLLFVAAQPTLSEPPWPFLAILFVLDLAIGIAALYVRGGEIHLVSLGASQVILFTWVCFSRLAPWPEIGIGAALAVAAFGIAWLLLARRLESRAPGASFARRFDQGATSAILLGQAVAIVAAAVAPRIGISYLIPAHAALIVALLWIAWLTDRYVISVIAVVLPAVAVYVWREAHLEMWKEELLFALALYALFVVYPLLLGDRARPVREPHVAAVLASVPFFFLARHAILAGDYGDRIGILPVAQAALMALLLWRLTRLEPSGERDIGRLALMAGAGLAFITVAIPLQLEKQWITIGWVLQAAALGWLYRKIPHRGLLWWSAALFAAVFVRLVFNPAVFQYHPRGVHPILNWYLYTYLVSAISMFLGARFLRATEDRIGFFRLSSGLPACATVLLFLLLNIEIADFYSKGTALTFNFSAGLSQNLTYTIGWGLFAIGLLIAGIAARSRPTRIASIVLLVATLAKCFLSDLWRLGGLFRVGSVVALAVCLALVAILIQRFVLREELPK
ncbi:MAG: DUF2339 domain-containing protein [Acidobacteriota bacterium]